MSSSDLLRPCVSDDELHLWLRLYCGLNVARTGVCAHHQSPFEYLRSAYFEPARDLVVWAPRGGGKTRLGAAATLLDLLHKPGVAVRILGGSFEQSLRMWEHLVPNLEVVAEDQIESKKRSARRITLKNGSTSAILTQSQRAVRGLRVQKLRCDEVEMFDPQIWDAAQLVTKSKNVTGVSDSSGIVCGTIEALSTHHKPFGLMSRILGNAERTHTRIIRWCLLEILERCPPERDCKTCPLWDDCQGIAKTKCDGHLSIDDAIVMKHRVSSDTWECEMLCLRPSTKGAVFPSFDEKIHVRAEDPRGEPALVGERETGIGETNELWLGIDFGFKNPFACVWVRRTGTMTYVFDEYVQEFRTIDENMDVVEARPWPRAPRIACDPAGAARNDQTAQSDHQQLKKRGYAVKKRSSQIQDGVEQIRCALKPAAGLPRLFIHPRCVKLIDAMRRYHYPNQGEVPAKDGDDHIVDALRYYFVNAQTSWQATGRVY